MNWPEVVALGIGILGFLAFVSILTFVPHGEPRPRVKSAVEKLTDDYIKRSNQPWIMKITRTYTQTPPEVKPLVTPPPADPGDLPN